MKITSVIETSPARLKLYSAFIDTDDGFKFSNDTLANCETNDNLDIQSRDIAVSPLDKNLIFIAGDDFHSGGVFRSYDDGATWLKDSTGLEGLRILSVLPSAFNKAWVICGADSFDINKVRHGKGIYISLDTGKTWKLAGAQGASVYSLVQHPKYPKFIAAACGRLGVYLSGSFGWSWESYSDGLPKDSSVRNIAIPALDSTNDGIVVYAGVYGDGVYNQEE